MYLFFQRQFNTYTKKKATIEEACFGLIENRLRRPMVKQKKKIPSELSPQCQGDLGCNPPPRYKKQRTKVAYQSFLLQNRL